MHSPAPWKIEDGELQNEDGAIGTVYGPEDFPYATEAELPALRIECEDNGRAIKAAPQLLAAARHILGRICADPKVAYLLGEATQSYELLCEAMAVHDGKTVDEIKAAFTPARPPATGTARAEACSSLTSLQEYVCRAAGVAPVVASDVIQHAKRAGLELYDFNGDDDEALADFSESCALEAFLSWADSKRIAA